MCQVTNDISTKIMKEAFSFRVEIGYELRQKNIFWRSFVNSVYNGNERVSFLGSKIWEMIPAGPILERKGMQAIFQKKGKKGQKIWKFEQ